MSVVSGDDVAGASVVSGGASVVSGGADVSGGSARSVDTPPVPPHAAKAIAATHDPSHHGR